ncbi:unnamed protein product [Mytilus coruscus]|uniref:Tyr recombinase domain-containing protein n=1 Tax=Mytilus coruscus TaxID=42192 RepID=A0A6J8BB73_MYTCO|nr:unnamed protein product [Mytilus coruscus]
MTLQLTSERKESLIEQCKLLLYQKKVTIRDLAQVIGKMVASEPGVKYAPLYFKDLEHFKDKSLKGNQGNFDAIIELDIRSKELLHWWIDNIMFSYKSMSISQPSVIFYSDASKTGWGGFNKTYQLTDNGFWTHDEILEHINFLELKAALLTLQSLGHMLHDTHIRVCKKNRNSSNKEQKVFISTVKPYKPVTKSTIARWVKTVMESSGINIEYFGPHSCRSASTSAALGQGLKLDTIMKSAGWKSAKTFQKFYNKTIITDNESNLAQKILPSSS